MSTPRDKAIRLLVNYFEAAGYTPVGMGAQNDFHAEITLLVDSIIEAAGQKDDLFADIDDRLQALEEAVGLQEVTGPDEGKPVRITVKEGGIMKALLMRVWSHNEFYDGFSSALAPISASLIEDVERYAEIVTKLQGPQGGPRVYGIDAFDDTLYWLKAFPEDEALMSASALEEYYATGYTVVEMPDTEAEDFAERYRIGRVDATTMQIYTNAVCWEGQDHYSNDSLYTATISIEDLKEALKCK